MAFSVTVVSYPQIQAKGLRFRFVTFAVSASDTYPSGGYPVAAADVNLTTDSDMYMMPQASGTGNFMWIWDLSTQCLRAYKSTGSAAAFTECSSTDCQNATGSAFVIGY